MSESMVTLTLAHPLTAVQAERLHAKEVKEYPSSGLKITMPRDDARALINAGYASGVDPENHDQVREALNSSTSLAKTVVKPSPSASA